MVRRRDNTNTVRVHLHDLRMSVAQSAQPEPRKILHTDGEIPQIIFQTDIKFLHKQFKIRLKGFTVSNWSQIKVTSDINTNIKYTLLSLCVALTVLRFE